DDEEHGVAGERQLSRGPANDRRRGSHVAHEAGLRGHASITIVSAIDPIALRRMILTESKRVNFGPMGSTLSIVDILAALYGGVLHAAPDDRDRDRFVLSKGHAAL